MPSKPTHGGKRPGSGRPKSGRTGVTLSLLNETIQKLESLAETRLEQADIIDSLVQRHLRVPPCSPSAE
jgi:hypothetical protein